MIQPDSLSPIDDPAQVLTEARRAGGEWAELFVERRDTEIIRMDSSQIAELRTDRDVGAAVRVVTRGRAGMAFTNVLSRSSLLEAARIAAAASGARPDDQRLPAIDLRDVPTQIVQKSSRHCSNSDAVHKTGLLGHVDEAARSHDRAIKTVSVTHVAVRQHIWLTTSEGEAVTDERVRTRLTCSVTAQSDKRSATGFCGPGMGAGMELYEHHPPESIGRRAAERAVAALMGAPSPDGQMPVVLGPSGGGLLLHEACGHGLEADGLMRGSSSYAEWFGRTVASPLVTAADDPTLANRYGSYGFDDEGVRSEATRLLESGMLVGAMTSRDSAAAVSAPPSANARRQSYAYPPAPRMSNTYIQPGSTSPHSIISGVQHGVFVAMLKGGDVNIVDGDFAFVASEAYQIRKGEIAEPLTGVTLLGNAASALRSVSAVGDDLAFTEAMCGKDGQRVPVSYGSPTLVLDGLTVSGGGRG